MLHCANRISVAALGNSPVLNLHYGRFTLDIRGNFFTKMAVHHWNKVPREEVQSPSLEGI